MIANARSPIQGTKSVTVACTDKSTLGVGVSLHKLTSTLQNCYDQQFLPVWGYPLRLYNTASPSSSDWQLLYVDDASSAKKFGYHELSRNGQPVAYVFVHNSIANNEPVSVTASHELFEMAVDPIANLWAESGNGSLYAYEVSDPVEDASFVFDGLRMSNFVHPAWFEPYTHQPGTKYDHLGLIDRPFGLSTGGYAIIREKGKVKEKFGSKAKEALFAKEVRRGHRSEYRRTDGQRI
jgi:hypothetical protein